MSHKEHWYAIRTLTGKEVEAERDVKELGIEAWCPMYMTQSKPSKKRKSVEVSRPLIPGYILARVPSGAWTAVRELKSAIGWVSNDRGPAPCADAEINDLMRRDKLGEFNHDGIEGKLSKGDPLEVLFGPLAGWHVTFVGARGKVVEAEVSFLGSPRKVRVPCHQVRLAG